MADRPSKMVADKIKNLKDTLAGIESDYKEAFIKNPKKRVEIDKAIKLFEGAEQLCQNLDLIVSLKSKKDPQGLWNSVIKRSKLSKPLADENKWFKFVDVLYNNIELKQSSTATATAPAATAVVPAPAPVTKRKRTRRNPRRRKRK